MLLLPGGPLQPAPQPGLRPERVVLPEVLPHVWPWLVDFQRDAVARATGARNMILWHPPGAGKTASSILWALAEDFPVLVTTRAAARRQFAQEFRALTSCDPYVLLPMTDMRPDTETLAQYNARTRKSGLRQIIVAAHGALQDDGFHEFLRAWGLFSWVGDELHAYADGRRYDPIFVEGPGRQRIRFTERTTIAARAGLLAPQAARRLGATATLVPDRVRDVWGQLDWCVPGCVGGRRAFLERYTNAFEGTYGWNTSGASNLAELKALIAPRLHIVSTAQLHKLLPPVRRVRTFLTAADLEARADAEANAAVRAAARFVGDTGRTANEEATEALVSAQAGQAAARKGRYVAEVVLECLRAGQRVVVFTGRRRDVTAIRDRLLKAVGLQGRVDDGSASAAETPVGIAAVVERGAPPAHIWAAHGETSAEIRGQIKDAFMADDGPAVLVGTGDAWGEALSLHKAHRLIIVLLPWTWRQVFQQEGRVRRLGQPWPVLIEYLIAEGTIDERIASVFLAKLSAIEALNPDEHIQAVRDGVRGGTDQEVLDAALDALFGGET